MKRAIMLKPKEIEVLKQFMMAMIDNLNNKMRTRPDAKTADAVNTLMDIYDRIK